MYINQKICARAQENEKEHNVRKHMFSIIDFK